MRYKHVLFINPYVDRNAVNVMMLFPPLGLEYVAASAVGYADKVTVVDLRYEPELSRTEKLLEFIVAEGVDCIGVSIIWDREYEEICALINAMPAHIPVIAGGYKATEKVEEIFAACPRLSIIVRGEGEESIREILSGGPLQDIKGISFRENNVLVHNPNRPLPHVDLLPAPNKALRRRQYAFSIHGIRIHGVSFDTVLSARGCPYNCKFCTFSLNPLGQKRTYSARSVSSVVDEIASMDAGVILFSDDNFFTDPRRAEQICDELIARKIKKRFIAQARIDIAKSPQLLKKMARAGFKTLLLGIESPHNRILEQFNKGFDQAGIRKAFSVLRAHPFFYHCYFIFGNIGETEEEMRYISKFAREIGADTITLNKLRIESFSPLRGLAESTPGYHITERGELYSDTFSHARLKKIGRSIKFSFFTPAQYARILYKSVFILHFFTFQEIIAIAWIAPRVLAHLLAREVRKGRLGDTLTRMFVKNT